MACPVPDSPLHSYTDETTHCDICNERYNTQDRKPRILHKSSGAKQHVACTACLSKMKPLKCPLCQLIITCKIEDLPLYDGEGSEEDKATFKKQVDPPTEEEMGDSNQVRCTQCEDDVGVFWCVKCRRYLCDDCKRLHQKAVGTKNHPVQELSSCTAHERSEFKEVRVCPDHGFSLDQYCETCRKVGCLKCKEDHCHEYKPLQTAVEEADKIIQTQGKSILQTKTKMADDLDVLRRKKKMIGERKQKYVQEIENIISGINQSLTEQKNDLLRDLEAKSTCRLESIEREIQSRNSGLEIIQLLEIHQISSQRMSDIEKLDICKRVKQGREYLTDWARDINGSSEDDEFAFEQNKPNIQKFKAMKIGNIQTPSSAIEDYRHSQQDLTGSESGETEIVCLAVGRKKSGRTRTLVALMTREEYRSSKKVSQPGCGTWRVEFGQNHFTLCKTRGFDMNDADNEKQDIKTVCEIHGPNIVLLILSSLDEDMDIVQKYNGIFDKDILPFVIVVFTCKKLIDKRYGSVQQYVRTLKGDFGDILATVKDRYIAVNTDDKDGVLDFRKALWAKIVNLVKGNHYRHLNVT